MPQEILEKTTMAKILPDTEIRKLLGSVILDAEEDRINPTGIEIRLGKHILFHSTDEEKELGPGMYVKVRPGESVTIASYERFFLTREAIHKIFPGCDLMALVTPTTTMMREGIMQATTKVESGWYGNLNWGLRNSSIKDFLIGYGEPIFKLTLFLLEEGETPAIPYGERSGDKYQNSQGIVRSTRTIPANISKKNLVESSVERLDPAKQLREAGYPFSHISTELTTLHGKFEVVSTSVESVKQSIVDSQKTVLEKVESLFDRKFISIAGGVIGVLAMMFGGVTFLQSHGITGSPLGWIVFLTGLGVLVAAHFLTSRKT